MEPTNKAAAGIEAASGGGKRRAREEEELFAARAGGREQTEEQQRLERKRQEREAKQRKERKQRQGEEMQREQQQQQQQQQQQRDERRRQQDARVPSGMVVSATVPASRMSREEMARTMPRRVDASTLQVVPPSQKRGALPTFPNPFAGQEARAMAPIMRREWEKIPRNKTPYSPAADIPPTPPLVLPARPFGSEETRGRGKGRQRSTVGEDHREDDEEDDEEQSGRWSSGESTPTPTASSVAAASARRRQEAKFMKPVTLTTPTLQPMGGRSVQVAYPSLPVPSVSPVAVQPSGQERPQSSSSIRLADGREIATVRTDFANLKKVSRPSSGSLTNSASTQEKLIDRKGKGKGLEERQRQDAVPPAPIVRQEKSFISFPTSDDGHAAAAPEAQTGKRITSGPDASLFPSADVLPIFIGASQPPRMSIVEEEEEAVATEKNASLRSKRNSTNAASLRRASFESSTTALDTPDVEGRLSSEFTTPADATDASNRTNRRALLTALVDPPSDVPEAIEPRSNTSAADVAASRPQADSFSTQIEQLQKFVVNSRDDHRPDTAGNRSAFSHVIPITNLLRTRRPGTGQTRFSEAISVARSKRLPSGHGNKPMCRQCFRAGFDCAMNLQLGEGTAGRKAFQDFVAAGGLDAISLAGEDKEGSVTASQALGKNYVDKLGEIAFGESALSRPVTRGAVNDMLEERSRLLADRQKQKTVEEFLAELNQVKIIQDQEDELERAKTSMENEKKDQLQSERKSSLLTRPTAITPTQADETGFGHPPAQADNQSNYAASSSASSDQLPFLADRWSIWRKTVHLVVLGLWIFSLQCLDSGYGNSLPMIAAALRADPQSIIPGRLSFLFGEAGGLLFGAGLSCYGRYRLPLVMVVMQGCLCVVIGFTKMSIVLTILRGTSGFLSGVFSLVAMGVVLDLMTTKRHRSIAMAALLAFVVAGQVAGPWIAHLILDLVPWSWLYWLEAVFAVVYCAVYGLAVRETAPESIYRANVINMRRQNDKVWTPEPRPLPTLKILLRDHLMRPFVVLFTHPIVILSALVLAVFLGSLVLALEGLAGVLVAERRMTATLANVVVTVSVALGALAAMAVIVLLSNRRGTQGETQRSRRLYIDEKGFIDSSKPVHGPESNLQPALGAVIAAVVALYTLALTAATVSWIFSALSLALLSAAIVVLVNSLFTYLAEAYYPATHTVLGELLAISDHLGPAPVMSKGDRHSLDSVSDAEHTLMSGGDEGGKRWNAEWALCVIAPVFGLALIVAGAMTLLSLLAGQSLSYAMLLVIAASTCLCVSLALVVLHRYGDRMRHASFVRIARTEQSIWRRQRQGSTDDSGSRSGSRPASDRSANASVGPGAKLRRLLLPTRRLSTAGQKPALAERISQPFNFVHIATGGAPSPPTPVLSRRATMQRDLSRPVDAVNSAPREQGYSMDAASPSPPPQQPLLVGKRGSDNLRNDFYHFYDHQQLSTSNRVVPNENIWARRTRQDANGGAAIADHATSRRWLEM